VHLFNLISQCQITAFFAEEELIWNRVRRRARL
jgi:hypothetical protein